MIYANKSIYMTIFAVLMLVLLRVSYMKKKEIFRYSKEREQLVDKNPVLPISKRIKKFRSRMYLLKKK